MNEHRYCPNCESADTEVAWTEWFNDYVERIRICNECPTEYTVSYGHPEIIDHRTYDE